MGFALPFLLHLVQQLLQAVGCAAELLIGRLSAILQAHAGKQILCLARRLAQSLLLLLFQTPVRVSFLSRSISINSACSRLTSSISRPKGQLSLCGVITIFTGSSIPALTISLSSWSRRLPTSPPIAIAGVCGGSLHTGSSSARL